MFVYSVEITLGMCRVLRYKVSAKCRNMSLSLSSPSPLPLSLSLQSLSSLSLSFSLISLSLSLLLSLSFYLSPSKNPLSPLSFQSLYSLTSLFLYPSRSPLSSLFSFCRQMFQSKSVRFWLNICKRGIWHMDKKLSNFLTFINWQIDPRTMSKVFEPAHGSSSNDVTKKEDAIDR